MSLKLFKEVAVTFGVLSTACIAFSNVATKGVQRELETQGYKNISFELWDDHLIKSSAYGSAGCWNTYVHAVDKNNKRVEGAVAFNMLPVKIASANLK